MNAVIELYLQLDGGPEGDLVAEEAAGVAERVCDLVAESHGLRGEGDDEKVRAMVVVKPLPDFEDDGAFVLAALDGAAGSYIVVHPRTSASELGMVEA